MQAWKVASILAVALSGCADISSLKKGEVYDPNEDAAVVIIGQALAKGCSYAYTSWFAPTGKSFPVETFMLANNTGCHERGEPTAYSVLKVNPGRYRLVVYESAYELGRCKFSHNGAPSVWDSPGYEETLAPKFTVQKGEVVYLGDILFEHPCAPNIVGIARNDAAAKAALERFPDFKAEPVYRPLTVSGRTVTEPENISPSALIRARRTF